uniref:MHC class I-like antigen recognition-like domain-containing protein n=1 Tax=Taeniopygia guttata TaxID=59729 RepID=H0ZXI4_TAEGU
PSPQPLLSSHSGALAPPFLVLHSLQFLEVALSEPGLGVPQSLIVGDVDGTPRERCGSEWGRMEAQTPGMGAGAEPGYWDSQSWDIGIARAGILGQPELGYWDSHTQDTGTARAGILGQPDPAQRRELAHG